MDNLALEKQIGIRAECIETGELKIIEGTEFWVQVGGSLCKAVKAASCLIEPEIKDKVLLFIDHSGMGYILSILVRKREKTAIMPFENGVSIKVNAGAFKVESPDLSISADRALSFSGADLKIKAGKGEVEVERMAYLGSVLRSSCDTIRVATRNLETIAERLIQRLNRSYRTVGEFEESRIGRLHCLVKGLSFMKAKNTTILAEKAVKMDGKKILLG